MSDESDNFSLPHSEGSRILGVILALAIMLGGNLVFMPLGTGSIIDQFLATVPLLLLVATVIASTLVVKGKSKTGIGIFLGLMAVILPLVVAGFGLIFFSGTHS